MAQNNNRDIRATDMRLLPAILIAVAIVLAPFVWHLSRSIFSPGGGPIGSVVDDTARIEIERLRNEIAVLRLRIEELEKLTMGAISQPPPVTEESDDGQQDLSVGALLQSDENTIADDYPKVVLIEDRRRLNSGLTLLTRSYLREHLGVPSDNLGDNCGPVTNPDFKKLLVTAEIGNIKARLIEPAVDSLRRVFNLIRAIDEDLYARIRSSGALCVRRIRGGTSISNHAYGMAIDLNIDGQLDTLGDGKTQLGLTIIADVFQREGWYWGASFGREDSMHFEVSRELFDQWLSSGKL